MHTKEYPQALDLQDRPNLWKHNAWPTTSSTTSASFTVRNSKSKDSQNLKQAIKFKQKKIKTVHWHTERFYCILPYAFGLACPLPRTPVQILLLPQKYLKILQNELNITTKSMNLYKSGQNHPTNSLYTPFNPPMSNLPWEKNLRERKLHCILTSNYQVSGPPWVSFVAAWRLKKPQSLQKKRCQGTLGHFVFGFLF